MPTLTDRHLFAASPAAGPTASPTASPTAGPAVRWLGLATLLLLLLVLAACGAPAPSAGGMAGNMSGMATRPAVLDTAIDLPTEHGLFQVRYTSDLDPIAINKLHTWTVHVTTPDGKPVDGATVTVTGGMPQHNHGMPTAPLVTPLGNGDYQVEGMKFQMSGWWTVTVTVAADGQEDAAVFTLDLP